MKSITRIIQKLLLLSATMLCLGAALHAQSLRGRVTDAVTKEPMVGTTVVLKGTGKSQYVQLDGFFVFKNLKAGEYTLQFSFVSYKTKEVKVTVPGSALINVSMEPDTRELNTVSVVANETSTDKRARTLEKNANQIVNVVSARSIELSPDVTVANVTQRVSGVTI